MRDFLEALKELVQMYRHRASRSDVIDDLNTVIVQVEADEEWVDPEGPEDEETEDETPQA